MICKFCGTMNGDSANFCHGCGKPLDAGEPEIPETPEVSKASSVCPYCGGQIGEGAGFCRHCGQKLNPAEEMQAAAQAQQRSIPEENVLFDLMPYEEALGAVFMNSVEDEPAPDADETIVIKRHPDPEHEEDLTVIAKPDPSEPVQELPPGTIHDGNAFWQEAAPEKVEVAPQAAAATQAAPAPAQKPAPQVATAPAAQPKSATQPALATQVAPAPQPQAAPISQATPAQTPAQVAPTPAPQAQPQPAPIPQAAPAQTPQGTPTPAPQAALRCPSCGGTLRPGIRYCGYCGISVMDITGAKPEKTEIVPVEELRKLKSLLDEQIITQDEFEAMKAKLLALV